MRRRLRCAGALAVALAAVPTSSLSVRDTAAVAIVRAHARQVAQPTFRTGTTRIVLDVVVRGRDHKPLPGLVQADFEVFEDGRQRPLTSFDEVRAAPASRSAGPGAPARQMGDAAPTHADVPTVAIIFEELGPEARQFARAAAASLVAVDSPVRAGVFLLRGGLEEVLPLMLDDAAIRRAIDVASERPGCPVFESHLGHRQAQMTACSPAGESPMHRQRGVNTFDGLATVVEALGVFHGRKTVALFSEGLDLTSGARGQFGDDRRSRFEELIARASHANVAFYTFDAAGLRLHTTATGQLMEEPRAGLSVLARETGGAFADGTNDLRPAVARMRADMEHYYLLAFDSARENDIGSVRVRVRVKARGASVLVRERYGRVDAAAQPGTGKEPNP